MNDYNPINFHLNLDNKNQNYKNSKDEYNENYNDSRISFQLSLRKQKIKENIYKRREFNLLSEDFNLVNNTDINR